MCNATSYKFHLSFCSLHPVSTPSQGRNSLGKYSVPSLSTENFLLFNLFHVAVKANLSFCRETYYSETDNNTEVFSIYCSQCRKKGKERVQSDYSLIKKYLKLERELATASNVLIKLDVLYIIIYFLSQSGRIRGFLLS